MMKRLFLLLLTIVVLSGVFVVEAQDDGSSVGECASDDLVRVYLYTDAHEIIKIDRHERDMIFANFFLMNGERAEWLGYAPRSLADYRERERLGVEYGIRGFDMTTAGETTVFYFLNRLGEWGDRYTVTPIDGGERYFIAQTTLKAYTRDDGTAYGYHIMRDANNVPCMWFVDKSELSWLN